MLTDAGCLTINEKDLAKNGHLHTQQLKVLHISLWPSGQPLALALAAMVAWPTFLGPSDPYLRIFFGARM